MATKKKSTVVTYNEIKEKAVCCGKIYVSTDKPISEFKCKNCGQPLVATKIPYVYEVKKS